MYSMLNEQANTSA